MPCHRPFDLPASSSPVFFARFSLLHHLCSLIHSYHPTYLILNLLHSCSRLSLRLLACLLALKLAMPVLETAALVIGIINAIFGGYNVFNNLWQRIKRIFGSSLRPYIPFLLTSPDLDLAPPLSLHDPLRRSHITSHANNLSSLQNHDSNNNQQQ